jgi:hypothetical protein
MSLAFGLHVALGVFSRLLEHDADLCACGFYDPTTTEYRQQAVAELRQALGRLIPREEVDRRTWLHPSARARIALLLAALDDSESAAGVRRTVARVTLTMAIVFAGIPFVALLVHGASAA